MRVQETNVIRRAASRPVHILGLSGPGSFLLRAFWRKADPNACQIFIVNNAPGRRSPWKAKGTPWTEGWHNVKVSRRVEDGTMKVYFDDMEKPLMTAKDKTFTWGQVGLGTFDDHGNFDDFELRGVRVEKTQLNHEKDKNDTTSLTEEQR